MTRKSTNTDRVYRRARDAAAKWVRHNHPDTYEAMLADAYKQLGVERRPKGRPVKAKP